MGGRRVGGSGLYSDVDSSGWGEELFIDAGVCVSVVVTFASCFVCMSFDVVFLVYPWLVCRVVYRGFLMVVYVFEVV